MQPIIPILTQTEAQAFVDAHCKASPFLDASDAQKACEKTVSTIIADVRTRGDAVLYELAARFGDSLKPQQPIKIDAETIMQANSRVSAEAKATLAEVAKNIATFGQLMMDSLPKTAQTLSQQGYEASFSFKPVQSVACYVPAGRYPLVSSALMTAVTAKTAGVPFVAIACANPADEVLYVAQLLGIDAVYRVGGAQALAAFAFGTQQIPQVDMVVGPGNAYVNEAKRQLQGTVGIDMLAGPSEVVVVADETANVDWVAADLLAQAEHDPDARVYLVTPSLTLAQALQPVLAQKLTELNLPTFLAESSLANSAILVFENDIPACIEATNALAPEHLQLHGAVWEQQLEKFLHYGAVFTSEHATVAHGDYVAGPNHTLPTGRSARFSSGLSPMTFLRVQNQIRVNPKNAYLGQHTQAMAGFEGLIAHGYSAKIRQYHQTVKPLF
jgi:histidinol dehydrogenase